MSVQSAKIEALERKTAKKDSANFRVGDTVAVHYLSLIHI